MFSRAVSGGFVCLRCQLQRPRPLHAARALPIASHSQLRRNGTESGSGDGGAEQDAGRAIPIEKELVGRVSRNDAPTNRGKDRVLYRSKGRRVMMKGENLGIDILGKPAEAIVMTEHSKIRPRNSPSGLDTLEHTIGQIDTENLFSEEGDVLTPEQVQANIEELRPVDNTILSKAEFDRLRDVLIQGFTTAQLQQYIQEIGGQTATGPETIVPNAPWIMHHTPWTPEAKKGEETIPINLRGYISSSMSPKQRLAIRLMRLSWDLSVLELTNAMGHLDIQLREPEFSLLVLGGRSWLADISRHYLRKGMHIELLRPRKTMRVIAPRAVTDTILQEVDTRLHNAVTETFKVTEIANTAIPSQLLHEVGRITNSIVSLSSSGEEVEVTFLRDEVQEAQAQSPKDVVFRLLLTACSPSSGQSQLYQFDTNDTESAKFIEDYGNSGKWAWKHRLSKWARWTSATTMTWTDRNNSHVIPSEELKWDIQPNLKDDSVSTQEHWPTQLSTATSATFGHVLHKLPPNGARLKLTDRKNERIMSPIIPPLTTISLPSETIPGSKNVTILMHFVPRPSSSPSAAAAPHLELRLDAVDASCLTISSLRAITAMHTSDVLLPHNRVDIRLNQTRYAELMGSDAVIAAVPAVDTYISRSRLELDIGSLETPALLGTVKIPRRLLRETAGGHKSGPMGDHPLELDYLFAGLELHRSVAAAFERWRFCYNSIEAGQGGGRRAELSLQAVQPGAVYSADAEEVSSAAFLRATLKASGCKELTWVGENWKDK